jgi:hypothetical protein
MPKNRVHPPMQECCACYVCYRIPIYMQNCSPYKGKANGPFNASLIRLAMPQCKISRHQWSAGQASRGQLWDPGKLARIWHPGHRSFANVSSPNVRRWWRILLNIPSPLDLSGLARCLLRYRPAYSKVSVWVESVGRRVLSRCAAWGPGKHPAFRWGYSLLQCNKEVPAEPKTETPTQSLQFSPWAPWDGTCSQPLITSAAHTARFGRPNKFDSTANHGRD